MARAHTHTHLAHLCWVLESCESPSLRIIAEALFAVLKAQQVFARLGLAMVNHYQLFGARKVYGSDLSNDGHRFD